MHGCEAPFGTECRSAEYAKLGVRRPTYRIVPRGGLSAWRRVAFDALASSQNYVPITTRLYDSGLNVRRVGCACVAALANHQGRHGARRVDLSAPGVLWSQSGNG